MEIKFENYETEGSIKIEDGEIYINIDSNTSLYKEITLALEKGMTDLQGFKNHGIPGKIKITRPYKSHEDILKLLRSLHRKLGVRNIVSIRKDSSNTNIIEIDELRIKRLIESDSCIREFPNRYEYCFIKAYEEKYEGFQCDSIQAEDVFIQLLTVQDKKILCSVDFPKENFDFKKVINWLHCNDIKIIEKGESSITNAHSIVKGFRFRGTPVILYKKGNRIINIIKNHLPEITETFIGEKVKINTMNSKEVVDINDRMKIIFNGKEVDYIPEIRLDLRRDILISNGHIVVASYVRDYFGCVGFFEEEGYDLPVAWIHDTETNIYIDIYEQGNKKIVFVQHNYSIDVDTLF